MTENYKFHELSERVFNALDRIEDVTVFEYMESLYDHEGCRFPEVTYKTDIGFVSIAFIKKSGNYELIDEFNIYDDEDNGLLKEGKFSQSQFDELKHKYPGKNSTLLTYFRKYIALCAKQDLAEDDPEYDGKNSIFSSGPASFRYIDYKDLVVNFSILKTLKGILLSSLNK
jgi:hypothetical protein